MFVTTVAVGDWIQNLKKMLSGDTSINNMLVLTLLKQSLSSKFSIKQSIKFGVINIIMKVSVEKYITD